MRLTISTHGHVFRFVWQGLKQTKKMIKTINFYDFENEFSEALKNQYNVDLYPRFNFTYEGKKALFEYLENLEEKTGEKIELDIVALCSKYTEYDTAFDCADNYYDTFIFEKDEDETKEEEAERREEEAKRREEEAKDFLNDNTQIIEVEGGGVIVQNF